MKKYFYILALLLITILTLSSRLPKNNQSKFKHKTSQQKEEVCGTCSAPTNLDAVKTGTSITLSWTSGPAQHSYGGYYNYYGSPGYATFSGYTNTYPVSITVPSSTYSITFQVTAFCGDGTYSTSGPKSKMF